MIKCICHSASLLGYIAFLNVHYVIPCIDVVDIFYVRGELICGHQ